SGRDLLRWQSPQPNKNAPLLVANPAFGRVATVARRGGKNVEDAETGNQGSSQIDPTQIIFQPLPKTEDEALAIKKVLPGASVLLRKQATEAALKQAKAPTILHIATHGFFLSDQKTPQVETRPIPDQELLRTSDLRLIKWAANIKAPLLRSGLALAGANQGKSGKDDGVLTALEAEGVGFMGREEGEVRRVGTRGGRG